MAIHRTCLSHMLTACAALFLAIAQAGAQEQAEQPDPPAPAAKADDDAADPAPQADEPLFRKLTGGADGEIDNPLEQAIRGMRQAQQRIDGKDAGRETRALQQDVVENLDELIERLKRQSQSGTPASSGSAPMPQDADGQPKEGQATQPNEQQQPDNGKTRDDEAPESTDDPREAEERPVAPLAKEIMVREVWGHLPPTLREKLLNVKEDKYLPKYDDLLRRYFESLAEEGRSEGPRR